MAPVQVFAVTVMVVHEGGHLGDGGGCVGRGAHGAVVLPSLTPLGFILHPLSLQSRLHLQDTETPALEGRPESQSGRWHCQLQTSKTMTKQSFFPRVRQDDGDDDGTKVTDTTCSRGLVTFEGQGRKNETAPHVPERV